MLSVHAQRCRIFGICMQDSFARARTRPKAARPSARATIGYLVYNFGIQDTFARKIGYLARKI